MDALHRNLLPPLAKPLRYQIQLAPNFGASSFEGLAIITFRALQDGQEVHLHSVDLEILEASLEYQHESLPIKHRKAKGVLILGLPLLIPNQSEFAIIIKYIGLFRDNLAGFYQSTYQDEDQVKHILATTHMEPNHARAVFPCFDEPDMKARFIISAVANKGECCLSNMPAVAHVDLPAGRILVTFAESEPMSTYLVALVIGRLNSISAPNSTIPITIYAPVGQEIHGEYAMGVAHRGLCFFEELFSCAYPLPKLDLVAIPDLSSGAMENWGLITFRPVELLVQSGNSSLSRRKRVTEVVLHEISHQWSGNLVTMKYWDSLWLNEGFATWMAKFVSDTFYPEWGVWQEFVADTLQQALELDALRSSHPVEIPVKDVSDVGQAYDAIAYRKGSSILRMIVEDVGKDTFFKGVTLYLKRHRMGNTTTRDLWHALSETSHTDVKATMAVWTEQTGFPVITILEDFIEGSGDTKEGFRIKLLQRRFLATGSTQLEADSTIYPLRISIRTLHGTTYFPFAEREMILPLASSAFFKINIDHNGFYRTAYPIHRLKSFGEAARMGLLSTEDKLGIIADTAALASSGSQKTSGLLDLILAMKSEPEYLVWQQITKAVKSVRSTWRFQPAAISQGLKNFAADIFGPKTLEIGLKITDNDSETMQLFKPLMVDAAGSAGVSGVIHAVQEMFDLYASSDKAAIHPDIRDSAFGIALANGGDDTFDLVVDIYRSSNNEEERFCALGNLGCVAQPALVQRTLALVFTDDIRNSEVYLLLWCLNESVEGATGLWNWATENWQKLESTLSTDMLRIVVQLLIGGFSTEEQTTQVQLFFSKQDTRQYNQVLAQEIEKAQSRMMWVRRDAADVEIWLRKNAYIGEDDE